MTLSTFFGQNLGPGELFLWRIFFATTVHTAYAYRRACRTQRSVHTADLNTMLSLLCCLQGIPVTITERWERWHIEGTCLSVEFYFSIPIADQPAAVRNTLQQLSRLPAAAGTTLQFSNYWWTAELAEAMAAVLPGLPQYQISVSMLDLTDEMLRIATAMGPCVHELATSSLQSQSLFDGALLNGPSVPWMGLSIGSVELSTLTRRIDPDGAPLLIRTDFVDLDNPYGQDEVGRTTAGLHQTLQSCT